MKNKGANNKDKSDNLLVQIEKRLSLAKEKQNGKHSDLDIPLTLTKNREWRDSDHGIEAIGSPNSFTTTNAKYGPKISELNGYLRKLKSKKGKSKSKKPPSIASLKKSNSDLSKIIAQTADQFVMIQAELDECNDMVKILHVREQGLMEEMRELREELSENKSTIKYLRLELVNSVVRKGETSNVTEIGVMRAEKEQ